MVRVAPQLIRLQAYRSVYDVVTKYIRDEHLRQVFSFHSLLVGGNPSSTWSIYTLIHVLERKWGVTFPRGGTGALVLALAALFSRLGGTLRLNTPVDEILTRNGRVVGVRTASGEEIAADAVAGNGDVVHTYRTLLRHDAAGRRAAIALKGSRFSMSLFLIYFGTRRRARR